MEKPCLLSFTVVMSSITITRGGPIVLVDDGKIVAIGARLDAPVGAEVIDAGGCYAMPGGIHPHTHLESPFMGIVDALIRRASESTEQSSLRRIAALQVSQFHRSTQ